MKGYAAKVIPARVQDLREQAARIVALLPEGLRCHEVARIVGHLLGLHVVDGWYGTVSHSWLVADGYYLDPYAVGRLPPVQVVDLSPTLPHRHGYQEGPRRSDIDEEQVTLVLQHLQEAYGLAEVP